MKRLDIDTTLYKPRIHYTDYFHDEVMRGIPAYTFFKNGGIAAQKGYKKLSQKEIVDWNKNLADQNITTYALQAQKMADIYIEDVEQIKQSPAFEAFCRYHAAHAKNKTQKEAWVNSDLNTALGIDTHQHQNNFKDIYQGERINLMQETVEPALIHLSISEDLYLSLIDAVNTYNNENQDHPLLIEQKAILSNGMFVNNTMQHKETTLLNVLEENAQITDNKAIDNEMAIVSREQSVEK